MVTCSELLTNSEDTTHYSYIMAKCPKIYNIMATSLKATYQLMLGHSVYSEGKFHLPLPFHYSPTSTCLVAMVISLSINYLY